jgi:hypothetical protein
MSHLRLPNFEGQVPVFISPRNRVAQIYPRALGSLSVTSYDSQGYGGGILTRLHTGLAVYFLLHNIYKFSSCLTGSTIHLRCAARNSDH